MKIIIIFIIATGVLFSSCAKDFLETKSSTAVTTPVALGSLENIDLAMRGVYVTFGLKDKWYSHTFFGIAYFNVLNDLVASNCSQPIDSYWEPEWNFEAQVYNTTTGLSLINPWEYLYSLVLRVNEVINGLEALNDSDKDKELYHDLRGQALTARAYIYQILNLHYSPRYEDEVVAAATLSVPLRKDLSIDPLPRNSQKEIIDFILKDIDDAIASFNKIPVQIKRGGQYLSLEAAKVVKLRMLMYMGSYDKVVTLTEDILSATTKTMMNKTQYFSGFNSVANPEWIFGTVISEDSGLVYYFHSIWTAYDYTGWGWSASPRALDMSYLYGMDQSDVNPEEEEYEGQIPNTKELTIRNDKDSRYDLFLHDSPDVIAANIKDDGNYYTKLGWGMNSVKFSQGMSKKFLYRNGARFADAVLMRLAEVYYIGAEAASLAGNDAQARAWLIKTAEAYDSGVSEFINTKSGKELRTLIANYKAVDMFCEGRILEDVKRRGDWIYRLDKYNAQRKPVSGQYKSKAPYNPTTVNNVLYFPDFTTMPVPAKAIETNPLLEQIKY